MSRWRERHLIEVITGVPPGSPPGTGAAIRAILGRQEALTRSLLDSVRIDHAAESATRRSSSTR